MGKKIGKDYKIDSKRRVVLPDEIMNLFNLQTGDEAFYELDENNQVVIGFYKISKKTIKKAVIENQ